MRGYMMIGHGPFPHGLVDSLKMIVGENDALYSVSLEHTDDLVSFQHKLEKITGKMDQYDEVMVFVDLLGGAPANVAYALLMKDDKYHLIAGMNFPMILHTVLSPDTDIEEILEVGKQGIVDLKQYGQDQSYNEDDE